MKDGGSTAGLSAYNKQRDQQINKVFSIYHNLPQFNIRIQNRGLSPEILDLPLLKTG